MTEQGDIQQQGSKAQDLQRLVCDIVVDLMTDESNASTTSTQNRFTNVNQELIVFSVYRVAIPHESLHVQLQVRPVFLQIISILQRLSTHDKTTKRRRPERRHRQQLLRNDNKRNQAMQVRCI